MGFFSDLWDGVKDVAGGVAKVIGTVVEKIFEGVFWLVEKIFDAVEAIFEWIDDAIDTILDVVGSFFTSEKQPGESGILPPTPEVKAIADKYGKVYNEKEYPRKIREGKGSIAYIQDGHGNVVGARLVGSDRGFDSTISAAHKRNRTFATRIK